jgi:hypothetical protein
MEKDTRGIGDNSTQETKYKSLFENLIGMVLEPKIDIDMYLKEQIERARTATRLADKFEALHEAEETRALYEDRLNTLEHFKCCKSNSQRPHKYMWAKLESQWGSKINDYYLDSGLKENKYEYGQTWKDFPEEADHGQ